MEVRRFAFETEFAPDGEILSAPDRPRTSFSLEEAKALELEAYARGRDDALALAEREAAAALTALAHAAQGIVRVLHAEAMTLRREAATLAMASAKAVAAAAVARFPEADVLAAIDQALAAQRAAPRLNLRLPSGLKERLAARIEDFAAQHDFLGAIQIVEDENLPPGAMRLAWGEGAIVRDPQEAFAAIEHIVAQALAAAQEGDHE